MGFKQASLVALGLALAGLHLYKPTLATAVEGVLTAGLVLAAVFTHKPGAAAYIAELEAAVEKASGKDGAK